jgi:hypothetical protein
VQSLEDLVDAIEGLTMDAFSHKLCLIKRAERRENEYQAGDKYAMGTHETMLIAGNRLINKKPYTSPVPPLFPIWT